MRPPPSAQIRPAACSSAPTPTAAAPLLQIWPSVPVMWSAWCRKKAASSLAFADWGRCSAPPPIRPAPTRCCGERSICPGVNQGFAEPTIYLLSRAPIQTLTRFHSNIVEGR